MRILKIVGALLGFLIILPPALILLVSLLFGGPREQIEFDDPRGRLRESVVGSEYMAVTGTPWATRAAVDVLERGGSAADAAVAALLVLNVTFGDAASFPSVAPLLYYDARKNEVKSYVGVGVAPGLASIEYYKKQGYQTIPRRSLLAQLIPASPDVIVELLRKHGRMSFARLSRPAIRLAREGFPVHGIMAKNLDLNVFERIGFSLLMPYNAQVYTRGEWWRGIHYRDRFIRPDLARTLEELAAAETAARQKGLKRDQALLALRDYFYKGPTGRKIVKYHEEHGGLFRKADLENYRGKWETPLRVRFGEYEILTNGTWTQGAAGLLALSILQQSNIQNLTPDTPEYIHRVTQAIELAMADREAYMGDPDFVRAPIKGLLSPEYARARAALLNPEKAYGTTPPPGNPRAYQLEKEQSSRSENRPSAGERPSSQKRLRRLVSKLIPRPGEVGKDTSYLAIVDRAGNSISLTPSDFPISPMIPGTGITLGIRMTQFRLDPKSPTSLEPGKRPRVTPHALMVLKRGRFYMSLGTPGGDSQTQAIVQVLLRHLVFGQDIQKSIEAPRFRSLNWPDSFAPHAYNPGVLEIEAPLMRSVRVRLEARGYTLRVKPALDNNFGAPGAIIQTSDGTLYSGADPREATLGLGK